MDETIAIETFSPEVCQLGEGAAYEAATDTAWWVDITGCRLFEAKVATRSVTVHRLPKMASLIAPIDKGRHLLATEDGLYVRRAADGGLDLLQPLEADNPVTRSNDGRVHPCGALWIGTMGKGSEDKAGAIYWFFKGELRCLYPKITIPNAICFSADGRVGYFTDTHVGILHRVELDPQTGLPVAEPSALYDHRGEKGGLDGAVVDTDGLIWNARYGGARVDAYDPSGKRVRSVELPARQPTCPVFVGPRHDRLLVTTAAQGLGEPGRPAATPADGTTLLLDVGVSGLPGAFAQPFA